MISATSSMQKRLWLPWTLIPPLGAKNRPLPRPSLPDQEIAAGRSNVV